MAETKSKAWIVWLVVGLFLCAGIGALLVPFLGGVFYGVMKHRAAEPPQVIWTTDADGCPDTCRRAQDCRFEPFDGEGCIASCESGVEVYSCIKTARSCSDMERCK